MSERHNGNPEHIIDKIEATRPLLDNLATQLLEAPEDRWNVVIGDDAGGRLVTKYVREVFRADGRELPPTYFIAGSSTYRQANGERPYHDYLQHIETQLGEPLRPLVITESVGTGGGITFLKNVIGQHSEQPPEVATLAVTDERKDLVDYIGGSGDEAIKAVWEAFESPPAMSRSRGLAAKVLTLIPEDVKVRVKSKTNARITEPTGNRTVGISPNLESPWPVVERDVDRNSQLASTAFRKMTSMAREYADARHFPG